MTGLGVRPRKVVAPDGRDWTVGRVLLPRPPRWKRRRKPERPVAVTDTDPNPWRDPAIELAGDIGAEAGVEALAEAPALALAVLVVGAVLAFSVVFVFPALVFIVDLAIVLLIAAGGIAVKVLFRRPWKIDARTLGPIFEEHTFAVVGLRASAEAVDTVAAAIQRGMPSDEIRLEQR